MIENIDKVLERGDRLELLVDKTANMQGNTFRFRKQARRFRSKVWWRNVKLTYVLELKFLYIRNRVKGRWMKSVACLYIYKHYVSVGLLVGNPYALNLSKGC